MSRFNNVLQKRINSERAEQKAQETLRNKYGIEDESKIVSIEKPSLIKLFIRLIEKSIRIAAITSLTILAATGIICILLPDTRTLLTSTVLEALRIVWPF